MTIQSRGILHCMCTYALCCNELLIPNDLIHVVIVVKLVNLINSRAKALQHCLPLVDETDVACGDFFILSGESRKNKNGKLVPKAVSFKFGVCIYGLAHSHNLIYCHMLSKARSSFGIWSS